MFRIQLASSLRILRQILSIMSIELDSHDAPTNFWYSWGAITRRPEIDWLVKSGLSTDLKALILFVALHGYYPNSKEFDDLRPYARPGMLELLPKSSRPKVRLQDFEVVPIGGFGVDITRLSRLRSALSGIPRVAEAFVAHGIEKEDCVIAWKDRRPVVLSLSQRARAGKSLNGNPAWIQKLWKRSIALAKLFAFSARVSKRIQGMYGARPEVEPFAVAWPTPGDYFILEVPDSAISDRLAVAKSALGNQMRLHVLFHDVLPLTHPHYFSEPTVTNHVYLIRLASLASTRIATTDRMAKQIDKLMDGLAGDIGALARKTIPIQFPIEPANSSLRSRVPGTYFVFIGGTEPRKNLSAFMAIVSEKSEWLAKKRIEMIVPIPDVSKAEPEGLQLLSELRHRFPEIISSPIGMETPELSELIERSAGVFYLSEAEGWGLPVVESASKGVPVFVADTPENRTFRQSYPWVRVCFRNGMLTESLEQLIDFAHRRETFSPNELPAFSSTNRTADWEEWARKVRSQVLAAPF